jgi:hypothetical protein
MRELLPGHAHEANIARAVIMARAARDKYLPFILIVFILYWFFK